MPVVKLNKKRLENLVDENIDTILENIPMLGADIEREKREEVDIEFFPNRPDLFSAEGIARAMRGFLDKETGLSNYHINDSNTTLKVKDSVKSVRPNISAAVIRDLSLSEEDINSLVNLQEHLHWGLGRDRKKVSIGLHDLKKIEQPFTYKAVDPTRIEFKPLGHEQKMNLNEILNKHKKGQKFGDIIKDKKKYPIIQDKNKEILSFPPIINGVLTEVDTDTNEIFIDVTGTDKKAVNEALNIIATSLAEIGGEIHSVKRDNKKEKTPNLEPRVKKLDNQEVKELTGLDISERETIDCLRRMRYGAKSSEEGVYVEIPAYRSDILHKWDLIEDVAIGYGYDNIEPQIPNVQGIGNTHPIEKLGDKAREIMTGLGYREVMTLTLTNREKEYDKVNRKVNDSVSIKNPISEEHTIFRATLLPSLLPILEINQHRDLPQKIFEFGEVEHLTKKFAKDCYHLSGVSLHADAGFTEVKSIIEAIFCEFGIDYGLKNSDDKLFLEGRRGEIIFEKEKIGVFGEISPDVLKRFDLEHPCVGFEIEIEKLIR
ncbi:phenylalanine--tRNA ligase subunit beta [archaeon SCG-AAA382B04]|nr:phenylalanine--tRNA ligase subunit beta [archaeon SCG-AAA382B04]